MRKMRDPDGRLVELTRERWAHILRAHPYVEPYLAEIQAAVVIPTAVLPGWEPNERWYYLDGVGRSRWLKVVVLYEDDRGFICTAFPRRTFP
jgi:hypothetical protein